MKVLFATHNKAKLKYYKDELEKFGLEVISLSDVNIDNDVEETSKYSLENAIKKATEYYKMVKMPTVAVDDALELDNIPENLQPGTHVRRINKKDRASDDEMIEYYTKLVSEYGKNGMLTGRWKKAIAIALNENNIKYCTFNVEKIFVNTVNPKRNEGYPLDSISITPEYNKYTVELSSEENSALKHKNNIELLEFIEETFK